MKDLVSLARELVKLTNDAAPGSFTASDEPYVRSEPFEIVRDSLYYLSEAHADVPVALLDAVQASLPAGIDADDAEEFNGYFSALRQSASNAA